MMRNTSYASPEMQVITIKGEHILCSSDFVNSPEKDYGFEWDDDLY